MGAIYRVNIIEVENLVETLKSLQKNKFNIITTSLNTNNSIYDISYSKSVVVIGNEANGVSTEVLDLADYKVKIPMLGKTESLNASVATGIMIYEYVRRIIKKWLTLLLNNSIIILVSNTMLFKWTQKN